MMVVQFKSKMKNPNQSTQNSLRQEKKIPMSHPDFNKMLHISECPYFQPTDQHRQYDKPRSSILVEGVWKINHLLDQSIQKELEASPTLKNITSFGKNAMENHGKRMIQIFKKADNKKKEGNLYHQKDLQFEQKSINDLIMQVQGLEMELKNYLIEKVEISLEIRQLIWEIMRNSGQNMAAQMLILFYSIMHVYQHRNLQKLNQEQITQYLQTEKQDFLNQTLEILRPKLEDEHQKDLREILSVWVQSILTGIKGIYQIQKRQRIQYFEDSEEEEWEFKPKKYIKFE